MNVARKFLETAARLPERPFLVAADGAELTYAQVLDRARRFAALLDQHGVRAGDRVILTFPSSVDYLCAYLGTLLRCCTALPVDFRSRPQHLDYVRTNCEAAIWVAPRARREFDGIPKGLIFPADLDRYPEYPMERLCAEPNPLALIMYTSGTTGVPKGVCLSHANLSHTIDSIIEWARVGPGERELTPLSLTHLFGLAHCHVHWTLGGTVYIEEKLQDIPRILEKISRFGITSFPGTPAGFKLIVDQFSEPFARHARNLKYIIVNSAPMAPEYVEAILRLLPGTQCYMYYGLTEASRSTYVCYNDHRDKLATVGRATPGAEVRVGTGAAALTDEVGEVLVRGPHVTRGYWGTDSSPYFDDGWFRTGDLGSMDTDGFLTWRGRLKEQINVDGLKLTPGEVEAVLLKHARVKDCAVVGGPDEMTGEPVVAFVVPRGEGDKRLELELRRHCLGMLELYKVPKRVLFVDEIPRTDTGKAKGYLLKGKLAL
jgi:long-chain acyl-CoA synthetase